MNNKYFSKIFWISYCYYANLYVLHMLPDYQGSIVRGSLRPAQTALIVDNSSK